MHTLYLLSVFVHVISAMTWLGGMLFLVLVIVPSLRRPELRGKSAELFTVLGTRFRTVGWTALVLLVVTGLFNVTHRGYSLGDLVTGRAFVGHWGGALATKLAFVTVIFALSAVHDFWLGPKATRLAREGAPAAERESARKLASVLGRVTFTLALGVVAIAITLVR
jgi:copper resistance protein D